MADDDHGTHMEAWIKRLRDEQSNWDTESAHGSADDVLCEALEYLGCKELVEEWRKVPKWYA